MPDPDWEMAAIDAYLAYGVATGGKNFRGDPMPAWGDLPEKIRLAWKEAAIAVALAMKRARESTYTCPRCGMTSHNPEDARHRYCGNCHRFNGTDEV